MGTQNAKRKTQNYKKYKSILARQDDGTVQLTITISQKKAEKAKKTSFEHLRGNLEIAGFRKGKAPFNVAQKHISQEELLKHTLQHVLPEAYAQAADEHKLNPILAPRFELISVKDDKDWTVRAITCELPEISLSDYQKEIKGALNAKNLRTPEQGNDQKSPRELTREEKEQEVIKTLIAQVNINIPRLLVDEEVNHKLSRLIEQLQKLGLTIEQYLSSTGKTAEDLRKDYQQQAEQSIKLELCLNKVAEEEKLDVDEAEVESALTASKNASTQKNRENIDENYQKRLIRSILLRRKALDRLVALA